MNNTFKMVGNLRLGKESANFHPYNEKEFNSGWTLRQIKPLCNCGGSSFILSSSTMASKSGKFYYYSTSQKKMCNVPFSDRKSEDVLNDMNEWNKYVIDLNKIPIQTLKSLIDDGDNESIKKYGFNTLEEVQTAYSNASKYKKVFASQWDFILALKKLLEGGGYDNTKFSITGDVNFAYYNGKYYKNYEPRRIVMVPDDTKCMATANVDLYFGSDSMDDRSEENGKVYINGWTPYYDSNERANVFADYQVVIRNEKDGQNADKINALRKKRFTVDDDEIKHIGVNLKLVNGSEERDITEDDLTEEQQNALFCGDITMDDIRRELGTVYGERIEENVYVKNARGFSKGAEDTVYTIDDMLADPKGYESTNNAADASDDDDDDDLWGDLD